MIIFRYLAKEVLTTMLAVSIVLLSIILSARFVSYLAEAAAGKLDAAVLLTLMAFRLPAYLELILPLGLFIGVLLAYGRLYVESEMVVLSACGMSDRRLVAYTLVTAAVVAVVVGVFSMVIGPLGVKASESLLAEQRNRTDFETLKPARFHELDGGTGITYAESISENKQQLRNVFMSETTRANDLNEVIILTAESGETVVDRVSGQKYLLLKNGRRYAGRPGEANYRIVNFESYYQRLPEPDYNVKPKKITDGLSTKILLEKNDLESRAALQWRVSMPILVLIVAMLAVPLSKTKVRQGRFSKMLPGVLLYIVYLVMLNAARGAIEKGDAPLPGLIWWVHALFFVCALLLIGPKHLFRSNNASHAQ